MLAANEPDALAAVPARDALPGWPRNELAPLAFTAAPRCSVGPASAGF